MELEIKSLPDYIQKIIETDHLLIRDGELHNEIMLFRGQSNKDYELLPSIGRNRECSMDISIFEEERNLIELSKFKLPTVFSNDLQPIDLLALLQHYGIPTRLLDITESPLVALYFACCSNNDKDGEVIVFKNDEKEVANAPVINALAESYKYSRGTFYPLSLFYGAVKYQPYFLEQKQMNEICNKTDEDGGEWIEECCSKTIFLYSTQISRRQAMQQGR